MLKNKKADLFFTLLMGIIICQGCTMPQAQKMEIVTEYVKIPAYTGETYTAVQPDIVDEAYMDSLMAELLNMYNEIMETNYSAWTADQVAYTTQGQFNTEEEWRAYLQKKYTLIENQHAKDDTAQMILSKIIAGSELINYEKNDYEEMESDVIDQLVHGNGFSNKEDFLDELEISDREFQKMVKKYTLESLKIDYVTEAIAVKEGLKPTEEDIAAAREEHMASVLEMGYTQDDDYYKEELAHWKEEGEEEYCNAKTAEAVRNFLYTHNNIQ